MTAQALHEARHTVKEMEGAIRRRAWRSGNFQGIGRCVEFHLPTMKPNAALMARETRKGVESNRWSNREKKPADGVNDTIERQASCFILKSVKCPQSVVKNSHRVSLDKSGPGSGCSLGGTTAKDIRPFFIMIDAHVRPT
jgi:hypothetical protein